MEKNSRAKLKLCCHQSIILSLFGAGGMFDLS
jgi:hypothetical protein